ncbi:MAG: EamA family transporter [Clostridia bacterium]|nr:EamA family transporter [Clostridia bacterium]
MLVSAMLIWGTIGIFRKYIPVSSAFLAFSRGMLGGLFMLAFVLVRRKKRSEKLQLSKTLLLALTGAAMGINWILLFEAYNYTSVAVATLCYYMEPTIVMLLSPFIFKERLSAKRAVCAAVAIVGMVLISGVIGGGQTGSVKGVLLGLGAAVLYSAVVIMNKRISGLDAYSKTAIELMSAGAVMTPYMLLTGGAAAAGFDARTVILLLTVGLIHTGVAYLLYFGSMDGLKAQSIAILSYIDPVSALLFSALFLKEALSLLTVIGAILIIGSAVAGEMHTDRK